jgi:hypothetical protein
MKRTEILQLIFAGVVAAFTIFNAFLWWNGRQEIDEFKKTAQGNFLLNLNRDFFLNERLYKLRKAIESNKPIFETKGGHFTEQDIDDYIGFFYLMSHLIDEKILNKDLIEENFCDFAEEAYENKEIKDYISNLRKKHLGSYERFEEFVKQCSEENK